ncbi:hypothetical protein RJ641_009823 [Dillenia turbinata]|uniref:Uncharacterized protein n=1 Tax=Dillenia turbinata TaxID=194707 RepID=A0AAN8V9D6_9MAGN
MVRLTADLTWKSPHFFNAIKERELDLRGCYPSPSPLFRVFRVFHVLTRVGLVSGNKIAVIENLGATEDQFDAIDLSHNEIVKLENFPYLSRLGTLILNSNRITRINPNIGEFLPKLHTLVLTNNRLVNLVEIDPLATLPKLQFLSLLDNNVTKKPNYRLYVIYRLKQLRLLDFRKVKHKERLEAEKLHASKEALEEVKAEPAKTFIPGESPKVQEVPKEDEVQKVIAPTPEQIIAIKAAIVNSQTLEEVVGLEKALKSGHLPANLKFGDNDAIAKDSFMEEDKIEGGDKSNEESKGAADGEKNMDTEMTEQVVYT